MKGIGCFLVALFMCGAVWAEDFVITIADENVDWVLNSYAIAYRYPEIIVSEKDGELTQIPNPETKRAFLKRKIGERIKRIVASVDGEKDARVAKQAAVNKVNTDLTITVK